ncbi:MAG TPA: tocopherol cyclase family protein [Solirubrobacteraceae bacterium]|nr:tocopherol cyclase family protein [Solirubrobacteraceae bacterium]
MRPRLRATGADLPFADLRRAHGVAMEGYFWRLSDPRTGRVVVALCGLCRAPDGYWATVALAGHPGGFLRWADVPLARGDTARFALSAGDGVLEAGPGELRVNLGADASLHVRFGARRDWPRALGGCGPAHLLPGLGQYWHPHLLAATVGGEAVVGPDQFTLDGYHAYAEKNWGEGGFPPRWWWGQAQGFDHPDVCVAFAGGDLRVGSATIQATSLVVALGNEVIRLGNPALAPARTTAGDGHWSLRARGPRFSVELDGAADPRHAHVLPVPRPAARVSLPTSRQHLAGRLTLVVRRRGRIVYGGESALAGLEVGTSPG